MMFVDGWSPTLIRVQTRRPAVIWKIGAYTTSRSLPMGLDQSPAATPIVASIRRPLRALRAPGRVSRGVPGWPESTCYAIDPTVPYLVTQSGSG